MAPGSRFVFLGLLALTQSAGQSEDPALQSQHAKELMASGRFAEAVPIYKQLVQARPGNPGLLLNLALAEHMAGRDRDAIPHLEAVLRIQPGTLPALISLAEARLSLNQPQQAIALLEKAVVADPKNPEPRGILAGALMDLKRFDQASSEYRKLTELTSDDARAWYGLGMSYQSIAIAAFERLQALDPESPYVAALVADTRVQRRQYRSAFFFYSEALKNQPGLHGVHAAMADLYRKTGHPDWAAIEDSKERALAAPNCSAHAAECQFLGGHDLQAISLPRGIAPSREALYWQAKAANELALQAFFRLGQLPPSVELHRFKAEIARNQGQALEAVNEWRAALALAPTDPGLRHELALALLIAQDYRSSLGEATALLQVSPQSPEMNYVAGESLLRMEQPEQAVPYLNAALKAEPKMLAADASLGMALARLGKNVEAIAHLERALELDDDGSLHYQLARAYQAAGNAEKARAAMAKYQEIVKSNEEQKAEVAKEAQIAPPPR